MPSRPRLISLLALATVVLGCEAAVLITSDTGLDAGADAATPSGDPPRLFDFRVGPDLPDRVYFQSDKAIVGTSPNGFVVSNESVAELFIESGALTGHYLRLSAPLDFWDNNTVRYDGGGDLTDTEARPLLEITLTYVENDIPEPSAPTERYVTRDAAGGGDGLSEASAWTLSEAFENAEPGMSVWMKAGDYGDQNFSITANGTPTSPIKFIGYRETVGDIANNYWDLSVPFSSAEMPTITGTFSEDNFGRAIYWISSNYVVFRNFQITNYFQGMQSGPQAEQANSNLIFERINGYQFNQPGVFDAFSSAFAFNSSMAGNAQFRFLDCVIIEYEGAGLSLFGDGSSLIDGVKIYHVDNEVKPESTISLNGDNNIIRNCHVEIRGSYESRSTPGIGIRGEERLSSTYNLIERSVALNLNEGFFIRNVGSHYNVIKDCRSGNNGATSDYRGGVVIWGGSDFNIVERLRVDDTTVAIGFKDNEEDSVVGNYEIGRNNIIRNCTFNNVDLGVAIEEQSEGGDGILRDNQIVGCSFNDVRTMFSYDTNLDVQDLQFIGCSFSNIGVYNDEEPPEGVSFSYCNFWDYWGTNASPPAGVGNLSVDPLLRDAAGGDLQLTAASPLIDRGTNLPSLRYDIDGNHRPQGTAHDIGAYEFSP